MNYTVKTIDDFFVKLDKMQVNLAKFSQTLDNRSEQIPILLKNFENAIFTGDSKSADTSGNDVKKATQKSLDALRKGIEGWRDKIEKDRKGKQFIKKNEKYLVVMVFGAVKAGKSSLGNFFAGKTLVNAPFDNHYKHIQKPIFETEERGRDTGDISKDSHGDTWFTEGVIDTTGAIQYFTLSGLRWIDSPGTGAVTKEGDTKNMTELVEEYLSYTDMCVFLMNSSEPGLQDDMKYMRKLSKEGQESLIVITKSDQIDEEIDDDGELIQILLQKPDNIRKLQEDNICERVQAEYPDIDSQKFRAISISTALANEAVQNSDDDKFKTSNIDKFMKILGDKVSDNAIARKQENPRRLLNSFVDSIVDTLQNNFVTSISAITTAADKYKAGMANMSKLIVSSVCREVRSAISYKANEWNRAVKRGNSISNDSINQEVSKVLQDKLNAEINSRMREIIEDFQSHEMKTVKANISAASLEKQTAQIEHNYTEHYTVERDPQGIIEHIRGFFGKKYYEIKSDSRTEYQTVDLGTNFSEFLDSLMPQVESYAKTEADKILAGLRDTYFAEHEKFAKNMLAEIEKLRVALVALKF